MSFLVLRDGVQCHDLCIGKEHRDKFIHREGAQRYVYTKGTSTGLCLLLRQGQQGYVLYLGEEHIVFLILKLEYRVMACTYLGKEHRAMLVLRKVVQYCILYLGKQHSVFLEQCPCLICSYSGRAAAIFPCSILAIPNS